MIEVNAGRMRHLWDGKKPDRVPLCGAWRMYAGGGKVPQLSTDDDRQRRHLCKRCERLAAGVSVTR